MIEVSISVEGQTGLTWSLWKRWVTMAEANGYSGLYRSDHFTMPDPPDQASLECIVSLAYLADHTSRVRLVRPPGRPTFVPRSGDACSSSGGSG
jgi:alkanesulfonate monooxygenase SsuD/methylene tetrahydromethanopterin reductase-like flavin-dependent oxidoreductase (luciferase family)